MLIIPGRQILSIERDPDSNALIGITGDALSNVPDGGTFEFAQQIGFIALPAPPQPGVGSAEAQTIEGTNNRDLAIGIKDIRTAKGYANLKMGESLMQAEGSDAKIKLDINGNVSLGTKTPDGQMVMLQITPTALYFIAPWGKITFDEAGFRVSHSSGANLNIMSCNIPGLSSFAGSMVNITADMVNVNANLTKISPQGSPVMGADYSLIPPTTPGQPVPPFGSAGSNSVLIGI